MRNHPKQKYNRLQRLQILEEYQNSDMTAEQIANKYGISKWTLKEWKKTLMYKDTSNRNELELKLRECRRRLRVILTDLQALSRYMTDMIDEGPTETRIRGFVEEIREYNALCEQFEQSVDDYTEENRTTLPTDVVNSEQLRDHKQGKRIKFSWESEEED